MRCKACNARLEIEVFFTQEGDGSPEDLCTDCLEYTIIEEEEEDDDET